MEKDINDPKYQVLYAAIAGYKAQSNEKPDNLTAIKNTVKGFVKKAISNQSELYVPDNRKEEFLQKAVEALTPVVEKYCSFAPVEC
jgi:hypothetical protein